MIVWLATSVRVGESLIEFTVKLKVALASSLPSETLTVMLDEPWVLEAGVNCSVQFGNAPANIAAPFGTSEVSPEMNVRLLAQLNEESSSAMVNAITPEPESSLIVRFEMLEMVGDLAVAGVGVLSIVALTLL